MSKYIIDVGDGYIRHGLERTLTIPVRINEHEDHWMDTRIPVTPYTEPDTNEAYQRGYEEGYAVGEAKKNSVEDEAYERGLNDAWTAARKIGSNSMCSLKEMGFDFSQCVVRDYNPSWFVVKNYSASEAIEKIRQYEQEQRQEEHNIKYDQIRQGLLNVAKVCNAKAAELSAVLAKMKEEP